jgi:hypothetical protein
MADRKPKYRFRRPAKPKAKDFSTFSDKEGAEIQSRLQDQVLHLISRDVPRNVRKHFPSGEFMLHHSDEEPGRYEIRIHLKTSKAKATDVSCVKYCTKDELKRDGGRPLAADVARILVRELRFWEEEWMGPDEYEWERKPEATRKIPGEPVVTAGERYVEREREAVIIDEVAPKEVRKLAVPRCDICGDEDRDEFPDWGPCPHVGDK